MIEDYAPLPLKRDGQTLAAFRACKPGSPLVFQHGLGADPLQTIDVIPSNPAYAHHLMHCRGHGSSEPGPFDNLSIATFSDDLISFMDQHIQGPCVIGGISMGAAITLRVAVKRPDLVSALILARPAWLTDPAPGNLQPLAEIGNLLTANSVSEARKRFLASKTFANLKDKAPENLTSLLNLFERAPQSVTSELLKRIPIDGPGISVEEISAINVPTLIIANHHDYVHPTHLADKLAVMIPNSKHVVITSKTINEASYVAEFRNALDGFLEDLP